MTSFWKSFLALFFPRICSACRDNVLQEGEKWICFSCEIALPYTHSHTFPVSDFEGKLKPFVAVKKVWCYLKFNKKGLVQYLIHALKYQNKPEIAHWLGIKFGNDIKEKSIDFDLIVPVPLHKSKLKSRGYNQSEYFAKGLSEILSIPLETRALLKTKSTETQTFKSRQERFKNVEKTFFVNQELVKGKRILLVDDVLTTGATLSSCSKILLESGCISVCVATIAGVSED